MTATAHDRADPRLVEGAGALRRTGDLVREIGGSRVLVLCGPSRRFVDALSAALGDLPVEVYDGARVHVPAATVAGAEAALAAHRADTVISLGGGAATGLAKALRLSHDVRFIAIPTSYSGSEMTSIFGITGEGAKRTGRDPRVRPDVVVHDPELAAELPVRATVQSLLNALAHPIGALGTDSVAGSDRAAALEAVAGIVRAATALASAPDRAESRAEALRFAGLAALALERGKMGAHHKVAHALGGRLDLPHAPLHSVLLPHSLAALGRARPALYEELAGVTGLADPAAELFELLQKVGAPTSIGELGPSWDQVREALDHEDATRDAAAWVEKAWRGERPGGSSPGGSR